MANKHSWLQIENLDRELIWAVYLSITRKSFNNYFYHIVYFVDFLKIQGPLKIWICVKQELKCSRYIRSTNRHTTSVVVFEDFWAISVCTDLENATFVNLIA